VEALAAKPAWLRWTRLRKEKFAIVSRRESTGPGHGLWTPWKNGAATHRTIYGEKIDQPLTLGKVASAVGILASNFIRGGG